MATQDSDGISLSFCHNQQHFRLLELPPELLDLLTSENAPVLSLKSSPSPSSPSLSSPINGLVPSHTVLTTHNQTFQLRQVQSSNSIFLLQPHVTSDPGTDDLNIVPDLSIVAECKATLELIPSSTSSVAWLKDLLPLYNGSQEEASFGAPQVTKAERRSKYDHLTNLPLSVDEFESGWREVCAFEIDGQALRPSVQCLVGAWKAVVSASTAQGIDLGRQFSITDILDILEADDYPRTLFEAVVWNLTLPESVSMGSVCLDKEKCICWVGATMLETLGQRTTPIGGFLEAWKNELPELWRTAATLDALKGTYSKPTSTTIRFDGPPSDSTLRKPSSVGATNGPVKISRKWHEKFRTTR